MITYFIIFDDNYILNNVYVCIYSYITSAQSNKFTNE